jgi:transketolase
MADYDLYRELGQQLRVDAVRASAKAGSGHPTSSMSAADLAAVLLAGHFRYDYDSPKDPRNDRLIFSKGHASPLVYGLFRAAGVLSEEEFGTYRQFGSRLEGTRRRHSRGSTSRRARSGRACRSASGWRSRARSSTGCRSASG